MVPSLTSTATCPKPIEIAQKPDGEQRSIGFQPVPQVHQNRRRGSCHRGTSRAGSPTIERIHNLILPHASDLTFFSPPPLAFSDNLDGTVIVTVITMRMMQVAIDEIIDVITMGYYLVPTARVVLMPRFVACAMMIGCASVGVVRVDFYNVLLNKR